MKPNIVIITGLAGSGKTVALRALEDQGFYCVDNLPVTLMEPLVTIVTKDNPRINIGVDIDVREKEFLSSIDSVLAKLKAEYHIEIIFLDAEKETLIRRFKETRRPHPLVAKGINLEDAIESEKNILMPLRKAADRIINTSTHSPHQLRYLISSLYSRPPQDSLLSVSVISFGFKFGIPQNIDLLFDVRFLPNPHFVPELKELTGQNAEVKNFVLEKAPAQDFLDKLKELLNFLIPHYIKEGKSYLTIAIGCTGGRHRSPVIAETVGTLLKGNPVSVTLIHRDIEL